MYPENGDDSSSQSSKMERNSSVADDLYFGTEAAMDQHSCLVFNLTSRVYERKELENIMEDGLKITQ